METKVCTLCKLEKQLSEYTNRKDTFDGKTQRCKPCNNLKQREQYVKHREKRLEEKKEYGERTKEQKKEYNKNYINKNYEILKDKKKEYYFQNSEMIKEKSKKYYSSNKEKHKLTMKNWIEKNKDHYKIGLKKYYDTNKEKIFKNLKKKKIEDPIFKLKSDISSLIRLYFNRKKVKKDNRTTEILGCSIEYFYSYIESKFVDGMSWENRNEWHLDHIVPIRIAKTEEEVIKLNHHSNFRPLWSEQNLSKAGKMIEEYKGLLHKLLGDDFVIE
jgi:hypothetical protein